jgi:hypothetical protein
LRIGKTPCGDGKIVENVRSDFESGVIVTKNRSACTLVPRRFAFFRTTASQHNHQTTIRATKTQKNCPVLLCVLCVLCGKTSSSATKSTESTEKRPSLSLRSLRSLWQHFFINHKPPEVESKSAKMMMCVMMHFDKDNCA